MIRALNTKSHLGFYLSASLAMMLMVVIYFPISTIDITFFHTDDALLLARLEEISTLRDICVYIFNTDNFKFRPISNALYLIEYIFFKEKFNLYIIFNIFLIEIIVIYYLNLIRESGALLKIFSSIIIVTSVYTVYPAWNIIGSFESLSAIIFLVIINYVLKNNFSYKTLLILSIILILTSEKYLPFLISIPFIIKLDNPICNLKYAFIYSFIIIISYVIMRYALSVPILVGTQTDAIHSSFDLSRFCSHFLKALFELFGFSTGPRYLTGFEVVDWVPISQLLQDRIYVRGLLINGILLIFTFYLLIYKIFDRKSSYFGLLLVMLALTSAASITFRLELRWLLPAYLALLLFLTKKKIVLTECGCQYKDGENFFRIFIFWAFLIISVTHNFYYISHFRSGLYFSGKISNTPAYSNIDKLLSYIKAVK